MTTPIDADFDFYDGPLNGIFREHGKHFLYHRPFDYDADDFHRFYLIYEIEKKLFDRLVEIKRLERLLFDQGILYRPSGENKELVQKISEEANAIINSVLEEGYIETRIGEFVIERVPKGHAFYLKVVSVVWEVIEDDYSEA